MDVDYKPGDTCKDCLFFRESIIQSEGTGKPFHICASKPPVPLATSRGITTAWPIVRDTDFCGDFLPKRKH